MTKIPNHKPINPNVQRVELDLPDNQYATVIVLPGGLLEVTRYQIGDDVPTIRSFITITDDLVTVVVADKVRDLSRVGE